MGVTKLRNLALSTHTSENFLDMHRDAPRVVIVGAGYVLVVVPMANESHDIYFEHNSIAGITMAVNLRSKLHHDNFVVSHPKHHSVG